MSDLDRVQSFTEARCGYCWYAPFIPPPNAPPRPAEVCILPADHDGDHRSAMNVTTALIQSWRPLSPFGRTVAPFDE